MSRITATPRSDGSGVILNGTYRATNVLTIEDAARLRDSLGRAIIEAQDMSTDYVQVRFLTGGIPYTYIDPSGDVQVGDIVDTGTTTGLARVVELGKGNYPGPYKTLKAKLLREELA